MAGEQGLACRPNTDAQIVTNCARANEACNSTKLKLSATGLTLTEFLGARIGALGGKKQAEQAQGLPKVSICGAELTNVATFKCLGTKTEADGQTELDIETRMAQAQDKFNQLSNIWGSAKLSTRLKLKIYRALAVAVLTHGCESWELTDTIRRALNGWNARNLVHLTGNDYRAESIPSTTAFDLVGAIRVRRLNYLASLLQENKESHLTFQVLQTCGPWAGNNSRPSQLWMGVDYNSWADLVTRARGIEGWREMIRVKFPHIKNKSTSKKTSRKKS